MVAEVIGWAVGALPGEEEYGKRHRSGVRIRRRSVAPKIFRRASVFHASTFFVFS